MAIIKKPIKKAQGGALLRAVGKAVDKGVFRAKRAVTTAASENLIKTAKDASQQSWSDNIAARKKWRFENGERLTKPNKKIQEAAERHHQRVNNHNKTNNTNIDWWNAHDDIEQASKAASKKKMGGVIKKAKDGMWMQKAAASIKRRGTAGKCTPITKPGCTGKAKALAKTFKKIAKSNKKK